MRVIRISEVPVEAMDTVTPLEGWTGGPVARTRQPILPPELATQLSCGVVSFTRGATTGWHTHTGDQLLVITAGRGIVATETERHDVAVGDIIHIAAGENHLHGAAESTMSHITIVAAAGS